MVGSACSGSEFHRDRLVRAELISKNGRHAFFNDAGVLTVQEDGRVCIQSGMLVQRKINGER